MKTRGISHGSSMASIACCIVGFFIFGVFFGLVGAGFGASAVMRKDKDNFGYIGIVLGIIVFVLGIVGMITNYGNPYLY